MISAEVDFWYQTVTIYSNQKSGAFLGLLLVFTLFTTKRKLLRESFRHYNWPSSGISKIATTTLRNPNQLIN